MNLLAGSRAELVARQNTRIRRTSSSYVKHTPCASIRASTNQGSGHSLHSPKQCQHMHRQRQRQAVEPELQTLTLYLNQSDLLVMKSCFPDLHRCDCTTMSQGTRQPRQCRTQSVNPTNGFLNQQMQGSSLFAALPKDVSSDHKATSWFPSGSLRTHPIRLSGDDLERGKPQASHLLPPSFDTNFFV